MTHVETLGKFLNLPPDQEDIRQAFRYIAVEMDRMEMMLAMIGQPIPEAVGYHDSTGEPTVGFNPLLPKGSPAQRTIIIKPQGG